MSALERALDFEMNAEPSIEPLEDEEQEDPCLHGNTGECQECWEFENYYCKGTPHEYYD